MSVKPFIVLCRRHLSPEFATRSGFHAEGDALDFVEMLLDEQEKQHEPAKRPRGNPNPIVGIVLYTPSGEVSGVQLRRLARAIRD